MKQAWLVFVGGGLGSMLRYAISKWLNPLGTHFFLGTFASNILGCVIIGLLLGLSLKGNYLSQNQMLLLSTGFCGGFTTFSTFSLEKFSLLQTGAIGYFFLYMTASIVTGLLGVWLGVWLSRHI